MTKLWSHRVAQQSLAKHYHPIENRLEANPAADGEPKDGFPHPGELEALNGRYGKAALLILPLKEGRFALFGIDRQLICIMDELDADEIRAHSLAHSQRKGGRDHVVESLRFGEPSPATLARDLRRASREPAGGADIDLADL